MQYSYTHITLSPFSETACDIITAMLSSIGYDSFEYGDDHIKAYIPADLFDADMLRATLDSVCLPSTTISHSFHQLEDKNWNETWARASTPYSNANTAFGSFPAWPSVPVPTTPHIRSQPCSSTKTSPANECSTWGRAQACSA